MAPRRTDSLLNKEGLRDPRLTLITSFKRVASLGKGMYSDALGSKTVEETLDPGVDLCGEEGGRGDSGSASWWG